MKRSLMVSISAILLITFSLANVAFAGKGGKGKWENETTYQDYRFNMNLNYWQKDCGGSLSINITAFKGAWKDNNGNHPKWEAAYILIYDDCQYTLNNGEKGPFIIFHDLYVQFAKNGQIKIDGDLTWYRHDNSKEQIYVDLTIIPKKRDKDYEYISKTGGTLLQRDEYKNKWSSVIKGSPIVEGYVKVGISLVKPKGLPTIRLYKQKTYSNGPSTGKG